MANLRQLLQRSWLPLPNTSTIVHCGGKSRHILHRMLHNATAAAHEEEQLQRKVMLRIRCVRAPVSSFAKQFQRPIQALDSLTQEEVEGASQDHTLRKIGRNWKVAVPDAVSQLKQRMTTDIRKWSKLKQVFIKPAYRESVLRAAIDTTQPTTAQIKYHEEMTQDLPSHTTGVVVPDDKDRTQAWACSKTHYAAWLFHLLRKDEKWQQVQANLEDEIHKIRMAHAELAPKFRRIPTDPSTWTRWGTDKTTLRVIRRLGGGERHFVCTSMSHRFPMIPHQFHICFTTISKQIHNKLT